MQSQSLKALDSRIYETNHARFQLNQKLRCEFHSLHKLILTINETIKKKTETIGLKAAVKLHTLQALALRDAFSRTSSNAVACIERHGESDGECQTIVEELNAYSDAASPARIEILADDLVMLATDIFGDESALQIVQTRCLDGHPILFRDVEEKLIHTIEGVRTAVEAGRSDRSDHQGKAISIT